MAEQIKVGMDAKRAFCNYRGLGNYSRLLIEGLARWAPNETQLYLMTPKISLPEYGTWLADSAHKIIPKGIAGVFPEIWRGYSQRFEWSNLGLDLYHGLSHDLPWGLDGQSQKTRTLVTIHDLIFMRHPELYPPWDRWTYLKKVKHSCRVADSIIAISEQTKIDLIELLQVPESKIKVLYQAIHPRYYKFEQYKSEDLIAQNLQSPEQPYFLYVGAFEERKNILRLLKGFARTQKQTNQQLILIGKGGLESQIRELAQSLSIESQVKVLSNVSSEELPRYYQQATALTYPSLFEGFGLPIVEALMSETLVLTSQGSCFPESGGPSSFYVDPLSEDDIAHKLLDIVSLAPEERERRIKLGAEHCQKFHWKQTTAELLAHYQEILKK